VDVWGTTGKTGYRGRERKEVLGPVKERVHGQGEKEAYGKGRGASKAATKFLRGEEG